MSRPCRHTATAAGCFWCRMAVARTPEAAFARSRWGGPDPAAGRAPLRLADRRAGCAHRGAPTGEARDCEACGGGKAVPLVACGVHGVCAVDRKLAYAEGGRTVTVQTCLSCPDWRPADPTPPPPAAWRPGDVWPGVADPITTPELSPVPPGWADRPDVKARHAAALAALLSLPDVPPRLRAEGDGVVICGGGRYWPMIVVAVKMLREVSDLPVQVWYRGAEEPVEPADVAGIPGVTLVDATAVGPRPRILRGWESKTWALLNCGFRRALFMDADAYFVADPAPLLDLATAHRFVFWQDLPHMVNAVKWPWFGALRNPGIPSVQGGQLAIDLVAFRRELMIAHWVNVHSDYFYAHQYGDQDSWLVALAGTGGSYRCLGPATWEHPAFVCRHGGDLVVHRCKAKLWGTPADLPAPHLPKEARVFAHLTGDGRPMTAEATFGHVYRSELWGPGGISGAGSTEPEARPYIDLINGLLRFAAPSDLGDWADRLGAGGPRRVVDLGCGDGYVTARLQAPAVVGVDCHRPHVDRLQREHPGREWLHLDLDRDREQLPAGDVALVKDVLQHWPTALVVDWLAWARACGKWRWLVLTNDREQRADDCGLGGFRGLDPAMEPLRDFAPTKLADYLHKAVVLLACDPPRPTWHVPGPA